MGAESLQPSSENITYDFVENLKEIKFILYPRVKIQNSLKLNLKSLHWSKRRILNFNFKFFHHFSQSILYQQHNLLHFISSQHISYLDVLQLHKPAAKIGKRVSMYWGWRDKNIKCKIIDTLENNFFISWKSISASNMLYQSQCIDLKASHRISFILAIKIFNSSENLFYHEWSF